MKQLKKEVIIILVFFVVFPALYFVIRLVKPAPVSQPTVTEPQVQITVTEPIEAPQLDTQLDLHSALVEQHMDGDSLVVTMQNTGTSDWKAKDWIRCTIFINGEDSNVRAELLQDQIVAVGESVSFSFPDIRSMLNETAEIVMLQETVTYFEERFPLDVQIDVEPMVPQENLHCALVEQYWEGDTLVVTLKNTGGSDWMYKDWICCTIFINGADSDVRAKLQLGQTVAVGESATFRFPDIRNSLNDSAEIVMLQETVAYFEDRFPVLYE